MIGLILLIALAIGCFSLAAKGFSDEGVPLSSSTNIKGTPAKVIGVICGVLGLAVLGVVGFVVLGSLARG
jgi:hypothetical protein